MGELRVDGKPGTLAVPAALDGAYAAGTGSRIAAQAIEGGLFTLLYIIMNVSVIGSLSDPYSNSGGAIGFVLILGFAVSVGEPLPDSDAWANIWTPYHGPAHREV